MLSHGHGATLVVSMSGGSVSLGIMRDTALVAETTIELPLEQRTREQGAGALVQLFIERATAFIESSKAHMSGQRVKSCLVVLHAPFSESQIVTATHSFEHERVVTDAMLDACAREALGDLPKAPGFLSASMLQSRLNGYPTNAPEGKRAQTIQLIGIATRADRSIQERLLSAVKTIAPAATIVIKPGVAAMIEVSQYFALQHDSLLLSFALEGTELVVIRDGVPEFCGFIPVGMRNLAQLAFPAQSPDALMAALRLSAQQASSETATTEAQAALAACEPRLAQEYGEIFTALSTQSRLPGRLVLIAEPAVAEWLSHFFARIDFAPFTFTAQPFSVELAHIPKPIGNVQPNNQELLMALALLNASRKKVT